MLPLQKKMNRIISHLHFRAYGRCFCRKQLVFTYTLIQWQLPCKVPTSLGFSILPTSKCQQGESNKQLFYSQLLVIRLSHMCLRLFGDLNSTYDYWNLTFTSSSIKPSVKWVEEPYTYINHDSGGTRTHNLWITSPVVN